MRESEKKTAYALKDFVKAVLDMATKPQIIRQWIKEKKKWRIRFFANESLKLSDPFIPVYTPKDKSAPQMTLNKRGDKWIEKPQDEDGN